MTSGDGAEEPVARDAGAPPTPTRMRLEIAEAPAAVARLLDEGRTEIAAAAAAIRAADPGWVSLVARGTSDHAAIHLRYLIETELGIPSGLAAPSTVTVYGAELRWRGGLVVAVSQSGRSPDLIEVVARARTGGALTIAIVNDAASPLAAVADHVIDCRAGEERSVAATKSYVAELAAGAALVAAVAGPGPLASALGGVPAVLDGCLHAAATAIVDDAPIVAEFADSERSIVIGRGFEFPTALETALKLKETGRLFAEGYSSADFSHGPVVLVGPEVPVLAIRPGGRSGPLVDEGIEAARVAGARPWIVGIEAGERTIALPLPSGFPEALAPLGTILPGQLLAEAVARRRGYRPDAPPGLHKITLTR
jgi:glucosamine--fructose-6-phosphate aminotransferase (isomerizing)